MFYPLNYGDNFLMCSYLLPFKGQICGLALYGTVSHPRKCRRSHALKIVRERLNGKGRFKLPDYVDGSACENILSFLRPQRLFVQAETVRRENLGKTAMHIDGALAEDALRASDVLKVTPYILFDAASQRSIPMVERCALQPRV